MSLGDKDPNMNRTCTSPEGKMFKRWAFTDMCQFHYGMRKLVFSL
jgi:hypothetical protein